MTTIVSLPPDLFVHTRPMVGDIFLGFPDVPSWVIFN